MVGSFVPLSTVKPITDIHRTKCQEKENQIVFTKYVTTFHTKQSKHQLAFLLKVNLCNEQFVMMLSIIYFSSLSLAHRSFVRLVPSLQNNLMSQFSSILYRMLV